MFRNLGSLGKFIVALFLGMNSGLMYALMNTTLAAYFADVGLSIAVIGMLSLRMLPYSFKFLWSPILDITHVRLFPIKFGKRKSWLISMQALLILNIAAIGFIDPFRDLNLLILLTTLAAFLAATHDSALDGYRIELFEGSEVGAGNSTVIVGFRIGLTLSAVLALYLADIMAWKYVFLIMSSAVVPCMLVTFFAKESKNVDNSLCKENLWVAIKENSIKPFAGVFKQEYVIAVLVVIAFFKISDGLLMAMQIPFLLELGFSKTEIGTVIKSTGIAAGILGTMFGGHLIQRFRTGYKFLVAVVMIAIFSNMLFIPLINMGANLYYLLVVNFVESFSSGITNIALITYMSALCDRRFTASHFAILNSISSLSRALLIATSGFIIKLFGWQTFFIVSGVMSIPAIFGLMYLQRVKAAEPEAVSVHSK
jgi:PAT family beta-lactamase induction signal transducer AmpG